MRHEFRPGDVVQVKPQVFYEGLPVGLSLCAVGDCIYLDGTTVMLLTCRRDKRSLVLDSTQVRFIRRGAVAS